jgi:2-keto-4-pentenoate hydratase/2-oxohepta-3-ene-1,7-dioic acid hydratase in catechol pathway
MSAPFALVMARFGGARAVPAIDAGGRVAPLADAVARAGLAAPPTLRALARAASWAEILEAGIDAGGEVATLLDRLGGDPPARADAELRLPIRPRKVLAAGRNFPAHARELGNAPAEAPFFFSKLPSCAIGPGDAIEIPGDLPGDVHHEGELAVVVGRAGRRIPEARALEHVAGYLCANDVTARTLQRTLQERRLPWLAAKNLDTFLALGPGIVPRAMLPDISALRLRCRVDGVLRQDAPLSAMLHGVASLLAHASRHLTLFPGDIVLAGTPEGVGPIVPGQTVEVEIDRIGTLANPVAAAG